MKLPVRMKTGSVDEVYAIIRCLKYIPLKNEDKYIVAVSVMY